MFLGSYCVLADNLHPDLALSENKLHIGKKTFIKVEERECNSVFSERAQEDAPCSLRVICINHSSLFGKFPLGLAYLCIGNYMITHGLPCST